MRRERLIEERKKRNKSQADVAADLEISEVYVRKLENGSANPGRDTMLRISKYYRLGAKLLFPDLFMPNDGKEFIEN